MIVAGIDPGLGGGMCTIEVDEQGKLYLRMLTPTPVTWTLVNKSKRRVYDVRAMWNLTRTLDPDAVALVLLEKQAPRKLDGKVATFSTGFGFGIWRGLLVARGLSHRIVEPRLWRSVLAIPHLKGIAGKHAIHDVVMQRLPDTEIPRALADAAALALAALTTPPLAA
jgi:Holliday junction resolvasome RuvABC endonuclease subunit